MPKSVASRTAAKLTVGKGIEPARKLSPIILGESFFMYVPVIPISPERKSSFPPQGQHFARRELG